ncbi:MAG: hypothetical protein HQ596_02645 [Candidatus Saganbacteria bacterium]|nr:hypothetical protein [Candidatus Saganbacteria bacterium]
MVTSIGKAVIFVSQKGMRLFGQIRQDVSEAEAAIKDIVKFGEDTRASAEKLTIIREKSKGAEGEEGGLDIPVC